MIVIRPIPFSAMTIISGILSTVTYPQWDAAVSYSAGEIVSTADGRLWKSTFTAVIKNGSTEYNLNHDPVTQTGFYLPYGSELYPTAYLRPNPTQINFWWVGVSVDGELIAEQVDEWKMFYQPLYEQTIKLGKIEITLHPQFAFNAVAFFNLDAASVTVEVLSYSKTRSTQYPHGTGNRKELAFLDLPNYSGTDSSNLKITIDNGSLDAKCGYVCIGTKGYVALSNYSTELTINDYSHKERDTFGNIELIQREYSSKVSFAAYADTNVLGQIRRYLAQLRSTPAAYIAHPDVEETLVFGFYSDFMMAIEAYTDSEITLEVEGLV